MDLENQSVDAVRQRRREQLVLLILAAVQFTSIVDFMVVMPLGPQLQDALHIGSAEFGLIVASYTFAAGVAGFIAAAIVDRYARRTTFMVLYAGFLIGTFCCALAPNYHVLVLARVITGAFGGIIGGISYAIIGDVFPEERRGRATGALMTGFAIASVVGVPLGIFLGTKYSWHVPFVALAIAGSPALFLAPFAMPPLNSHVGHTHTHPLRSIAETFTHSNHLNAFALIIMLMLGSFTVFPYLSLFLVNNVGMSDYQLEYLYIAGGALSLVTSPIIGRLADKYGKLIMFRIIIPMSVVLLVLITHLPRVPVAIAVAVFGALMMCNVGRMIAAMAMITGSIEPHRRGAFMSANSSVQHIASGLGAYLAGAIIQDGPDHQVLNFGIVGWVAGIATLSTLWLAGRVQPYEVGAEEVSAEKICLAAAAEAAVDDQMLSEATAS